MNGHRVDDIDEALMVDGVYWKKGLAMYGPWFFPRMVDVVPSLRGLQRAAKIYRRSLLLMHHRSEAVVQTSFSSERISLKFTIIQHLIAT